jgi:hypothetical protein
VSASAPLRFLALTVGGWVAVRTAMIAPGWWEAPVPAERAHVASAPAAQAPAIAAVAGPQMPGSVIPQQQPLSPVGTRVASATFVPRRMAAMASHSAPTPLLTHAEAIPAAAAAATARPMRESAGSPVPPPPGLPIALPTTPQRRWSASAWALIRDAGGGSTLAPGGTLGGSQAGARILYRVGSRLALSGRAYLPLRRPSGAEAAAGLDWNLAGPVHLLAERRQRLGAEGRSAFALTLYGGGSRELGGGLRADLYAQTGVVGRRGRDLFVDAGVRITAPVGPVEVGGGLWGAAQPGAERLDAGPSISYRLPTRAANIRLQADWRFRVAGDAAPGSGPALTLAADF